ncbi:MAG: beta-propeller domain-containing protein [Clostridia bacterium]|nr:beta-propeller domain-containing protein [Clostridia bacterium]
MNNQDNYKKAIEQIHASDELKEKAFENAKYAAKSKKYSALKYLSTCAAVLVLFFVGINSMNKVSNPIDTEFADKSKDEKTEEIIIANAELPRFESIEQLKEALKLDSSGYNRIYFDDAINKGVTSNLEVEQSVAESKTNRDTVSDLVATEALSSASKNDYSTTNTQVENVDEADIVKTDGEHIYYVLNGVLHIVKADTLEVVSNIKIKTDDERFTISEIFLKGDKVVLLGNGYILGEPIAKTSEEEKSMSNTVRVNTLQTAKAIVYNIENKNAPEMIREVALEGNYIDSRMVGDNLYFISRKYAYFYGDVEDYTILPVMKDSIEATEEIKRIDCTDIVYFEGTEDRSFMIVGGFNINENEEVCVETFFGAGDTVYANDKNLYLTQTTWGDNYKTTIYKFGLEDSRIKLLAKGEVEGELNNQFSMDEYDGNLRVATTSYITVEPEKTEDLGDGIMRTTLATRKTTNNLFVLNENLEEIGKIENLAEEEQIYSVRFIGKIGYIVTFKEVDPLFVIDLSDPSNPTVKGELKIPGYSSYLHPYDENHIIGIGYNTKDNGYGGVTNSTMKMSMFDVSDLENPEEIFNVDIGTEYANSEVIYNHKALFYKKSENLIGFPVNYRSNNYRNSENGFIIFRINLENNQFEKYGEILQKMDYRSDVRRVIYIEDVLYTLGYSSIVSYDLNTFEKLNEVEIKMDNDDMVYELLVD